jgi:hypothetical protein
MESQHQVPAIRELGGVKLYEPGVWTGPCEHGVLLCSAPRRSELESDTARELGPRREGVCRLDCIKLLDQVRGAERDTFGPFVFSP